MGWGKQNLVFVFVLCFGSTAWSERLVVGGSPLPEGAHPEVVELLFGSSERCTATFITAEHVLTAAHCTTHFVPPDVPSPFQIRQSLSASEVRLFQVEDVKAARGAFSYCPHLEWPYLDRRAVEACLDPSQDVAILKIKGASKFLAELATSPGIVGDLVFLFGFGRNHLADEWIKRTGQNRIESRSAEDGYIIAGPGCPAPGATSLEAITSSGDSGGPLMNAAGQIIGVTSTLRIPNRLIPFEDNERLQASFADVLDPMVSAFISETTHASILERAPMAVMR